MVARGCATIVIGFALTALLFFALFTSMIRSFADWRVAANGAAVAIQQTEQVRIQEDGATDRTRIEWAGRVEIAQAQAGAVKESSWPYLLLWTVQFAAYALSAVAVVVALLASAVLYRRWRRGEALI